VISFSGGRTSGYMLYQCLTAGLADDVHVVFANTGREREETLAFVNACARMWNVQIHWVEYDSSKADHMREVTYATAARDGEPFTDLIRNRKFNLPNPVQRFCTQELKIRVMKSFMTKLGYDYWTNVVGLRGDEPNRVHRSRNSEDKERWVNDYPLYTANVVKSDVLDFWRDQPFDLQLKDHEGNCDLCFMKGRGKIEQIMIDHPHLAKWWIDQEAMVAIVRGNGTFRKDRPSYSNLEQLVKLGKRTDYEDLSQPDCSCTD